MRTPYASAHLAPAGSLVTVAHVVYALHAVSLAIGAFGAATLLGSFLFKLRDGFPIA